jgi:hypothetical protein
MQPYSSNRTSSHIIPHRIASNDAAHPLASIAAARSTFTPLRITYPQKPLKIPKK